MEPTFGNVLILMLGLAVTYWMSRAPLSLLKLMGTQVSGMDKQSREVASVLRWWGRVSFFLMLTGMLLMVAPEKMANAPGFSLVVLLAALCISGWALRRPKKDEQNPSLAL